MLIDCDLGTFPHTFALWSHGVSPPCVNFGHCAFMSVTTVLIRSLVMALIHSRLDYCNCGDHSSGGSTLGQGLLPPNVVVVSQLSRQQTVCDDTQTNRRSDNTTHDTLPTRRKQMKPDQRRTRSVNDMELGADCSMKYSRGKPQQQLNHFAK